ncbi:galectin-9-like [Babylonia areolata]|uniref:galectin-9-like n=1 Tax=Babylonia areolata TaxID=304850 RepID=UPI003FD1A07D
MAYRKTNVKADDVIETPGGLNPGSQIIVRGRVLPDQSRFSINLRCAEDGDSDIAFHFNPRIDDNVVVRNTRRRGSWQEEERDAPISCPFKAGQKFTVRIMTTAESYNVMVNNSPFIRYNHRCPAQDVRCLHLGQGAEYYEASVQNNCRAPFACRFPGGLKQGQAVRVRGMVKDDADRFHVNFQKDEDGENILLHFNPRQGQNDVVLNSRRDGDWEDEQTGFDDMPFKQGHFFDLFFIATDDKFNVYVNEEFFTSFDHRSNYRDVHFLRIDGDVELMDVDVQDPLPDDILKEIPQGLEKNDLVVVKGFFFAEGNRFAINLIKGTSLDDDISLHFNPRRDQDEVVLNSKEGGDWEEEEKHPLPPAMTKMVPFEVEILAKSDKFKIFVNDKKVCKFRARDDMGDVRAINVNGDAYIYEVKLLRRLDEPFVDTLPGKLETGNWIQIVGAPDDDADGFALNLQHGPNNEGDDIAFHFNPRFNSGEVIRNTCQGGDWGSEESDQPFFPFQPEDRFELMFAMLHHGIRVFVNHRRFIDYAYRLNPSDISHIFLSGGCDYFEPEFY